MNQVEAFPPREMTAVVLTAPGSYEVRHDVGVPRPGQGEVLCKVMAVAICGSDPKILKGPPYHQCPTRYPFIAGHEWAGIVVAAGPGVHGIQVGDRVAGEPHRGCGFCENCKSGRYSICINYGAEDAGHAHYGFVTQGAYAQYVKCHFNALTVLPDNVSFEEASICDTAGVALHGLERSNLAASGTVCVIGPGPIGIMAMKLAKIMGAAQVIAVGRGARLQAALDMGAADIAINFEMSSPVEEVMRMTSGIGADNVYEASGAPGALAQAIEMARKGGTVGMLGTAPEGHMESIPMKAIPFKELTLTGSRGNPNMPPKILRLLSCGRLSVKELITHRFPLDDFAQGMETFISRKGDPLKVVFFPNGAE